MSMIPVIDGNGMNPSALKELLDNNCTMPDIRRVVYNLKTFEDKAMRDDAGNLVIDENTGKPKHVQTPCTPVLATSIEFVDNTKAVVKNSLNDKIDIEEKTLDDGTKVTVASEAAKEIGLVYCILKRYVGKVDPKGTVIGDGFGRILRELVDGAYDEKYEQAKVRVANAAAKKLYEETKNTAKPRNPSMLETVVKLADSQKELAECIKLLREDLDQLKAKLG